MSDLSLYSKAQGVLLGQVAGDSLGSLVEFQSPEAIRRKYPDGVRELVAGGTFNTLPGQPTDDSEMALLLARSMVDRGTYDPIEVRDRYVFWLESHPFDCGGTIKGALLGHLNLQSQANGALMRSSPIGIAGARLPSDLVATWAEKDAALTHPNAICLQVNALFVMAIAAAIREALAPEDLYRRITSYAQDRQADSAVLKAIHAAADGPPGNFMSQMGWVLIAFQNALYQLLHAPNLEEGVIDSVMRGGDTDTNAAIAGALLGAVHGIEAVPQQWLHALLLCRPWEGDRRVHHPRPECFWPVDALELAERLLYGAGHGSIPGTDFRAIFK